MPDNGRMAGDDEQHLSERERAHLRGRDRKRRTDMVVDNAAVKRVRQAIVQRRSSKRPPPQRDEH